MVPQRVMGVLLLLMTAVSWAAADTMVMRDGRSFDSVRVDGFQANGAGGVFMVRMLENGAPSPQAHGVEASLVERIEFREATDTRALPQGRAASMIMADGRMHAVTVEHAYPRPEGVTFHVRQQGVPYGGASHDVVSTRLRGLDLTGAMAAAVATPTPTPEPVVTGGFDGERMHSSLDETDGSEDSSWDEDEDSSD